MKNKKPKKKGEIEEVVGEILEAGKAKKEIKKKKVGIIPRHTIFGCNAIGTNSPQEAPLALKKFSAELQILMKRHKIIKVEAFLLAKWPEDPFIIGQKIKK